MRRVLALLVITLGPRLAVANDARPLLLEHVHVIPMAGERVLADASVARRLVHHYASQGYDYIKIAKVDDEPAGLSRYDAIRSATTDAAGVLGILDHKGTVSVGKDADWILVGANPFEDLSTLAHPTGVVVRGEWIGAAELAELRDRKLATENGRDGTPVAR